MAMQTTPHTESGKNHEESESDLEPGVSVNTVARGDDAALYAEDEGAQTATNRGPAHAPGSGPLNHGPIQPDTNLEGSLTTRAPQGEGQGITGRSLSEESVGQKKVVEKRDDAQAAINQSK